MMVILGLLAILVCLKILLGRVTTITLAERREIKAKSRRDLRDVILLCCVLFIGYVIWQASASA